MPNPFAKIAEEAIDAASSVKCSIRKYQEGLQLIIDELQITLEASTESDVDTPDDDLDEDADDGDDGT